MIRRLNPSRCAAFAPDGPWLATGGHVVSLWDLSSCQRQRSWPVPSSIADLAFSRDGRLLAAREDHARVSVFDIRQGALSSRFDGVIRVPYRRGFCFTGDDHIAIGSYDGSVYRFAANGALLGEKTIGQSVRGIAPCGPGLLAGVTNEPRIWRLGALAFLVGLTDALDEDFRIPLAGFLELQGFDVDEQRNRVWVTGMDHDRKALVACIDLTSRKELSRLAGRSQAGMLAVGPTGEPIAFDYRGLATLKGGDWVGHGIPATCVAASPGRWLAIAGDAGTWVLDAEAAASAFAEPVGPAAWADAPRSPASLGESESALLALPADLRDFLAAGRQWEYHPSDCRAGRVLLHRLSELEYSTCGVTSYDTDVAEEDPAGDEDGWYSVPMVSLVASCENYGPDFLLSWLPDEQMFATYDVEHRHLRVFPGATWQAICASPAKFINSQWEPADDFSADARPWLVEGREFGM